MTSSELSTRTLVPHHRNSVLAPSFQAAAGGRDPSPVTQGLGRLEMSQGSSDQSESGHLLLSPESGGTKPKWMKD